MLESEFWELISLRLVLAAAAAGVGSLAAIGFKKINHLGLCALISFAAGSLLSLVLLDILPETLHSLGFLRTLGAFFSGYLLFWGITKFVAHICPACSATHTEADFKAVTISMVAALSVHSFMDGLAIYSASATSSSSGLLVLMAVVFHKIPEGLALSLVAMGSGMSRRNAFLLSVCLESVTTLAGGLVGFLFSLSGESPWVGFIFGHVGGGFLFLVIHALLGKAAKHDIRHTLIAATAGALSIAAVGYWVGAF